MQFDEFESMQVDKFHERIKEQMSICMSSSSSKVDADDNLYSLFF